MAPASIWHDIVDQVNAGTVDLRAAKMNRTRYSQGQNQEARDRQDGERDALRVIAGLEPLRSLDEVVTPAYRAGWDEAVGTLGGAA